MFDKGKFNSQTLALFFEVCAQWQINLQAVLFKGLGESSQFKGKYKHFIIIKIFCIARTAPHSYF